MEIRKWATLLWYSGLTFIVGLNFFSISHSITDYENSDNQETAGFEYQLLYLGGYVFIAPISFWCLWKNFEVSIFISWVSVIIGLSVLLIGLDCHSPWTSFIGRTQILLTSILVIPACGTLSLNYFSSGSQLLALSFSCLANPLGISISYFSGQYLEDRVSIKLQLGLSVIFCVMSLVFKESECILRRQKYIGVIKSFKYLWEDQERFVMFFSSSISLANTYAILTLLYGFLSNSHNKEQTPLLAFVFTSSSFFSAVATNVYKYKYRGYELIFKVFMVMSVLSLYLWSFSFSSITMCLIYCLTSGMTILGRLPMKIYASIEESDELTQPVASNMIFYTSTFLVVLIRYVALKVEDTFPHTGMVFLATVELFAVTAYISEYSISNRGIKKALLRKKKINS